MTGEERKRKTTREKKECYKCKMTGNYSNEGEEEEMVKHQTRKVKAS